MSTLIFLQYIDTFIYELGLRESNLTKRARIDQLKLNSDEWARVKLFTSLLAVCYWLFVSRLWLLTYILAC